MYAFKCLVSLTLLIGLESLWAGEVPPLSEQADKFPRVAVLCEQQDPELLGLSEQVEVLLAQRNDLALLDRANMDQLLREQGLIAKQGQDMETIVRIGKLLRTDLLVVAGKYEGFFAWRFIDVKNGVLAGLHVTRWPTERRAAAVAELGKAIESVANKMRDVSGEGKRYLSIVRFVNQDLSRQFDSLEEVLPVLLSAQLASQPGIGLVERSRLGKVAEEKIGTEGAEGEYKPGTLIVKGEISILRSNATTSVSVAVSAGKPNQAATIRLACTGPLGDLPSLARSMTEGLLKAMEVKPQDASSTDTTPEADTFYLKGNFFTSQNDILSAISLHETACLLNPTNTVYREAYRGARRGFIGNKEFSQKERLRYYIEDMDDWKSRFYSGGITTSNVAQAEGWYNTDCIAMGEPKQEPLAEQWRTAYDGYRALLDLMFDYCKTNNIAPSRVFRDHLSRNLLPWNPFSILQRMHRRDPKGCQTHEQAAFFKNPQDFCRYFGKYVDSEYPSVSRSRGHRTLTPDIALMSLQGFVALHVCSQDGIQPELDHYARAVFDKLLQDSNPLIRIWAKLALIQTGYEGEMFVIDGRTDAGQSVVNELAFWKLPYLPCDSMFLGNGNICTRHLLLYLIRENRRDIMPAVESIRQALKEPGASYTPALDALVNQLFCQYDPSRFADMGIQLRTSEKIVDPLDSSKTHWRTGYRSAFETITTPYHEWTDILCQHLDSHLKGGYREEAIKDVKTIFLLETISDEPEKAVACMAQITKILQVHQPKYKYDIAKITNVAQGVSKKMIPEVIQSAKVAWHLNREEIPNGRRYYSKDYVVFKDNQILYYKYPSLDTRRGPFDVTVIDLATGRILQSLLKDESLRYPADPELGIPKQEVRSWCEMDGRYYVGCVGGFGEFADGAFTMLASSRKEQVVGPLDGGESYTVTSIRPNPAQKKLYLLVQGSEKRDGIWEYTPATGEQKRLINLAGVIHSRLEKNCWDNTHLYVKASNYTLAFNTEIPDESFVITYDFCQFQVPSNSAYWKERGLLDIRIVDNSTPVNSEREWRAQAVWNQYAIFTHGFTGKSYLWKAGAKQPKRLVLLDKLGQELTSTEWLSDVAVAQWTATPRGFVYQLKGGGIGLFSDVDCIQDGATTVTNMIEAPLNDVSLTREVVTQPPATAKRIPAANTGKGKGEVAK